MSRAKRHHYVPAAYLARFGERGSVAVRRRGGSMFTTGTRNVAVESGFYELTDQDGKPTDALERILSELEGAALGVLRDIDASHQLPTLLSQDRATLAIFLAVQFTRTAMHRERVTFPVRFAEHASKRERTQELMASYLQQVHLGFRPSSSEVQAAWDFAMFALQDPESLSKDAVIRRSMSAVPRYAEVLQQRRWALEVARKPRFITSDAPLVLWRPPSERDRYAGFGLTDATEIRFPISPALQIVLTTERGDDTVRVEPDRVRTCNADLALASHKMIVGHPRRERQLREITLPARRSVLRFNTGPGYRPGPDGEQEYIGEILHTWVPRQ